MSDKTDSQIVWDLIKKLGFCMLVTHSKKAGDLRARPMTALPNADEGAIYFLTDVRNQKDDEIDSDQNVCLTFADSSAYRYVSVTGIATVSNDREKIGELWSTAAQLWWNSKDDPNIRILQVTPERAEYWDGPGSIVTTIKMVAAVLTGSRPNLGENKKVEL